MAVIRSVGAPNEAGLTPERQSQLVVVLNPDAEVVVRGGRIVPDTNASRALLDALGRAAPDLGADDLRLRPLFAPRPDRVNALAPPAFNSRATSPLSTYFIVDGISQGHDQLAEQLRGLGPISGAYVKPPAELPAGLNDMIPRAEEPPSTTPDFTACQGYFGPAPTGIEAVWAQAQPGGTGAGINVIDVEGAWRFTHEDLITSQAGIIGGTPSSQVAWRNHGTAVAGVIGGSANGFGVTGIAPDVILRAIAIFGPGAGSSAAIRQAADALSPGNILLIELHRPGPNAGESGQFGYIPVEWWPDDYDAIVYAVMRGILVVEAGGNGSQNLDDVVYDMPQTGFPAAWRNPFRRGGRDSGAIVVGAGAPPPGTHQSDWGPDRSRLDFSNYGSMVDVQGWGREVTTCGYGDLQGGTGSEDYWYTDQFSGTSSASPIVTGALASVQGILRAAGSGLLTPASARQALRETGSPQQSGRGTVVSERIGARPDIRALVTWARGKAGKEGKEAKEAEGRKFPKLEKNEFKDLIRENARDTRPIISQVRLGIGVDGALGHSVMSSNGNVANLRHFIPAALRPDLVPPPSPSDIALREEPGKREE